MKWFDSYNTQFLLNSIKYQGNCIYFHLYNKVLPEFLCLRNIIYVIINNYVKHRKQYKYMQVHKLKSIIISIGKSSIQNFIISCTMYLWLTNLINSYMHRMHNLYSQLVQFSLYWCKKENFERKIVIFALAYSCISKNNIKHAFLLRQDTKVYSIEILRNFCLHSHMSYNSHTQSYVRFLLYCV